MVKSLIISFSGGMGSGKDTQGVFLAESLRTEFGLSFEKFSFAGVLKDEITNLANDLGVLLDHLEYGSEAFTHALGVIAEKYHASTDNILHIYNLYKKYDVALLGSKGTDRNDAVRESLQYWGTDVRRAVDKNYWVRQAKIILEEGLSKGLSFYVTDARFENELELLYTMDAVLVKLYCSEEERVRRIFARDGKTPTRDQLDHASETSYLNSKVVFDLSVDVEKYTAEETAKIVYDYVVQHVLEEV